MVTHNTLTNLCYSNLLKDCNAALIWPTETGNFSHNTRCTCYIVRKIASTLILVSFIVVPRAPEPLRFCPYPDQMVDQHLEMTFTALNVSGDQDNYGAFPLHGTARYGTVHFWGVFHWVLYLVPDTFLVPLRSRFQASRTVTKT